MRVLRALADPAISGVTPDLLLLAVQKPVRRRQVVNVGGRSLQMVHQTPGVGADVQLHPEMPLVPLPRLVHLRVAGVALVLGRRRRRDDGGVNDAALLQQNPPLGQVIPDLPKQKVRQSVALQPVAEVGIVVSSGTFSSTAPAKRRMLSASQAGPPSADRSGCRTAERSARAASPTADAAVAPSCRRPSDTPAQCGPPGAPRGSGRPSAPERSRGASCASCDRIRGWQRSIAEGAACRDPPKERRGAR